MQVAIMSEKSQCESPYISAYMAAMKGISLYHLLKFIQPEHLTENAWAKRAKINRSWFQDLKNGATPRADTIEKVVGAAGFTMAQFYDLDGARQISVAPSEKPTRSLPFRAAKEPLDIPLLGTAMGSDMEVGESGTVKFVERMDLDLSNVTEYLRRPEALLGRDDVYAITVIGDSVSPKYESGDPAYVSSKQRPRNGEYVVVQLKRRGSDGEDQLHVALLKMMVRMNGTTIELSQTNPNVTFSIPLADVHAVHRVIPWKEIVFF